MDSHELKVSWPAPPNVCPYFVARRTVMRVIAIDERLDVLVPLHCQRLGHRYNRHFHLKSVTEGVAGW